MTKDTTPTTKLAVAAVIAALNKFPELAPSNLKGILDENYESYFAKVNGDAGQIWSDIKACANKEFTRVTSLISAVGRELRLASGQRVIGEEILHSVLDANMGGSSYAANHDDPDDNYTGNVPSDHQVGLSRYHNVGTGHPAWKNGFRTDLNWRGSTGDWYKEIQKLNAIDETAVRTAFAKQLVTIAPKPKAVEKSDRFDV